MKSPVIQDYPLLERPTTLPTPAPCDPNWMFSLSTGARSRVSARLRNLPNRVRQFLDRLRSAPALRLAEYRSAYSLRHVSGPTGSTPPGALLLFAVCRNERLRLPHFFAHYHALGVEHFFLADNGSTDGTLEYLREQPATTVFSTAQRYDDALYGIHWMHTMLRRYGVGHWCVLVDIDEFLTYPHSEDVSLGELCRFLEAEGATSLPALLIDMYSKGEIDNVTLSDDGLLGCSPWFDPDGYFEVWGYTTGGPRARIFGLEPCVNKVPLVRYRRDVKLRAGCHSVENTVHSALRAGLLHFKFLDDFPRRAAEEAARKQHWRSGEYQALYCSALEREGARNLWYPGARRYASSADLLACGLARSSAAYDTWRRQRG